jgi:hypothetical protein
MLKMNANNMKRVATGMMIYLLEIKLNRILICRHHKPIDSDDSVSNQNICNRFSSVNDDPVVEK